MIAFLKRLFRRKPVDYRTLVPSLPLVAVTLDEGGYWFEFPLRDHENTPDVDAEWHKSRGFYIHSMLFEDGSVWDAFNGWRERRTTSAWIMRTTGKAEWWWATGCDYAVTGFVPRSKTQTFT